MPVQVNGNRLTITPDRRILGDPAAKLPIYIDPGWTGKISGNAWTSVWSNHKSSSFWKNEKAALNGKTFGSAGAGRTEDCPGCSDYIVRSLFRMDTAGVRGKHILSAQFRVKQMHAWTCSPKSNAKLWMTGSISSGTTWNKQPTWYSSPAPVQTPGNRKVGAAHGCLGAGDIEFNVTAMVAKAAASKWTTLTMGLRAVSESTLNQWKRFDHTSPRLAITYNTDPNAPGDRSSDNKACATGAARPYVLTTTPVLYARQSDPDSGQVPLTTWFYYWPLGGSRNKTNRFSVSGGNPSPVSKSVPAGKLIDDGTYVWQSRTYDGSHYGPWSGTCEFTVDATPPNAPGSVSSTDYPPDDPNSQGRGGVGVPGIFHIAPPAEKPEEAKGYAWTFDSGVQPSAARTVEANEADHSGAITVPPSRDGVNTLRVWTMDRAGRFSAVPRTYTFKVRTGLGPAAEWYFDEPEGEASDATAHGNSATLGGGAFRTGGRSNVGSALSLNGTSAAATLAGSVKLPHPDTGEPIAVRTDSSFTVSAWVWLTDAAAKGQQTIIAANGSTTSAYALSYSVADDRWRIAISSTDTSSPPVYGVLSDRTAAKEKWTHVAATYDAGTKKVTLYVNGTAQANVATAAGTFNATTSLTIGKRKWNGSDDGFLNGTVDDVRVYGFSESPAKLAEQAVPLAPSVSFPSGNEVSAGGQITVTFDARDDINVTKFRYSVDNTSLNREATAEPVGKSKTVSVDVGSTAGEHLVYAVAVTSDGRMSTSTQATFVVKPTASLSGVVMDLSYQPVAGATVRLEPAGLQMVTGEDGGYTFSGFPPGEYTVTANHGSRCGLIGSEKITVSGYGIWQDVYLSPYSDELGHTCTARTLAFTPAEQTVLPLTGDDAVARLDLPFAFPFYGASYRSAWVDTNGVVSFDDPGGSHPYPGGTLPAASAPNALVAPFWDDLVVDSAASVRTENAGSGADSRVVIEWRNVHRKASADQRLSFEVALAADGTVTTNYTGLDNDVERGAQAAVGIGASDGEDGLTYSAGTPVLSNERAVVFDHPGDESPLDTYRLSGTLVDASGATVAGATVRLDPSGLSTRTGADGAWSFPSVVADSYAVAASLGDRCAQVAREQVDLTEDKTLSLRLGPDYGDMGYACTTGTATFVPATTVVPLTGTFHSASVTLPFPFTFHGLSYTRMWVYDYGGLVFDPHSPAVTPFGDDRLVVDGSASVRTLSRGTPHPITSRHGWVRASS